MGENKEEKEYPNFERFLATEFSLPSSLRQYIRKLKENGEYETAVKTARRLRLQRLKNNFRKLGTVDEELLLTIDKIANSGDLEVTDKFRSLWLLHRKGIITLDGLAQETKNLLAANPNYNLERLAEVKDEVLALRTVEAG